MLIIVSLFAVIVSFADNPNEGRQIVIEAPNEKEAIEELRLAHPDVILDGMTCLDQSQALHMLGWRRWDWTVKGPSVIGRA